MTYTTDNTSGSSYNKISLNKIKKSIDFVGKIYHFFIQISYDRGIINERAHNKGFRKCETRTAG